MSKKRVLIIDDEADLFILLRERLEYYGYEVSYLNSSKDVLKVIQGKRPDLILLDIMLPDKNGYDICFDLKRSSDTASIPIVIFTAKIEWKKEMKELCDFVKADDYISKPFEAEVLLTKIKGLVEKGA